jgi:hypothetical protein
MKHSLRRFFSLFLLSTFLFAYTEKNVHDIVHSGDEHCHVLNEKHIHTAEHHCAICDFEFPFYDKVSVFKLAFTRTTISTIFLSTEQNIALRKISSLPSRGPPTLS